MIIKNRYPIKESLKDIYSTNPRIYCVGQIYRHDIGFYSQPRQASAHYAIDSNGKVSRLYRDDAEGTWIPKSIYDTEFFMKEYKVSWGL